MKVLHVITTMDFGGAEKHLAALALAQANSGIDVRIAYLSGEGPALPTGIPATHLDFRRQGGIRNARRWLRGQGIVHAHLPRSEIAGAWLASRRSPLVISRHNTEPFLGKSHSMPSQLASRAVASRADTVIAISRAVERYHVSTGHLSPSTRIEVIPYGYLHPDQSTMAHYNWGADRDGTLRIACVARLTHQKDLATLLRGVAELRKNGLNIDLRIAGEGPDRAELLALREHLGLAQEVSFLGKITNPEAFIAGADIFALTSRYEGLGLVLLEAMGAGTPIVAARNTAIAEVVLDGVTGLLFETGNHRDFASSVTRIVDDPLLTKRLVDSSYQRLHSEFSVDTMTTRTSEVYRGAIERF